MKNLFNYRTVLGNIRIVEENGKITNLLFYNEPYPKEYEIKETEILKQANIQLQEYLKKERKTFDLPINIKGTPFQQKVWDILKSIPYGETRNYKEIANQMESKTKIYKSIGSSCNQNPIPILIPCHRVIGVDGDLKGYKGGIEMKRFLLHLESN